MQPVEIVMQPDAGVLDAFGLDGNPRIFYVVRRRYAPSNAELRALGVVNFPGRTPGLPDDDPLWRRQGESLLR